MKEISVRDEGEVKSYVEVVDGAVSGIEFVC